MVERVVSLRREMLYLRIESSLYWTHELNVENFLNKHSDISLLLTVIIVGKIYEKMIDSNNKNT